MKTYFPSWTPNRTSLFLGDNAKLFVRQLALFLAAGEPICPGVFRNRNPSRVLILTNDKKCVHEIEKLADSNEIFPDRFCAFQFGGNIELAIQAYDPSIIVCEDGATITVVRRVKYGAQILTADANARDGKRELIVHRLEGSTLFCSDGREIGFIFDKRRGFIANVRVRPPIRLSKKGNYIEPDDDDSECSEAA